VTLLIQALMRAIGLWDQQSLDVSQVFIWLNQVPRLPEVRPSLRLLQVDLEITGRCSDAEIVPLGAV